ncbi:MAG: replication protein, partial [Lactobacillus iners]|nr:replication protein [Lactobacillus iners]
NYTKPSMVANPYINMLAYKGLPDILKQMDSDHDYLLKQAQKQAETKRKQLEAVEQHGDKYINKNTGEVVDKIYTITLRLTGTKEQLTQLSKFIQDWGIKYEKVGK